MKDYWQGPVRQRISRRRSLAAVAGLTSGMAALFLFGCGSDSKGTKSEGTSLLAKPEDRTEKAVKGATYPGFLINDIGSFDFSITGTSGDATASSFAHSR